MTARAPVVLKTAVLLDSVQIKLKILYILNDVLYIYTYNLKKTVLSSNYWHIGGNRLPLLTKNALMKRCQKFWAAPPPSFEQNLKEQQFFLVKPSLRLNKIISNRWWEMQKRQKKIEIVRRCDRLLFMTTGSLPQLDGVGWLFMILTKFSKSQREWNLGLIDHTHV